MRLSRDIIYFCSDTLKCCTLYRVLFEWLLGAQLHSGFIYRQIFRPENMQMGSQAWPDLKRWWCALEIASLHESSSLRVPAVPLANLTRRLHDISYQDKCLSSWQRELTTKIKLCA